MLASAAKATSIGTDLRPAARGGSGFGVASRRPGSFFIGNAEPSLDELMDDPIMRGLMARDGVAADSLRRLIDKVRARLV